MSGDRDVPSAPDGQFDGDDMPTTDGELSDPGNPDGVLSTADRTIDPDAPNPDLPEGAPVDPDLDPDAGQH